MKNQLSKLMTSLKILKNSNEKLFESLMSEKKLTMLEISILGYLIDNEANTAHDIETTLQIKKSNISISIERLIRKGYLKRQRDEVDRRIVRLILTVDGIGLGNIICDLQKKFFISLFEGIPKEEVDTYFNVLMKISNNVDEL